ncbi:MAG: phosphate regulon sensor histidine kinase PhoR [SAR86 cluster bacterium]|uniref:histidine kinase n=1 Tax=SAR86 cluster bacterium TaxID=2030880 RepID=A0A2A4X599_9GAMM|nr:MAG: phosphate regulon sensor histidine kinase PhoR [SAR86 cluster bacterium]
MQNWRSELNRLCLLLSLAAVVGYAVGHVSWAMLISLCVYYLYNLYQLRRFNLWLNRDSSEADSEPPESFGLWGNIFDGIYRLQKQERRASSYLANIVDKAQESSAALKMAVVMINRQGNLDWWNFAAEKLLGLQHPKDRNQSVTNLIRNPSFSEYFHSENYDETLKMEAPGESNKILEFQIALFGENERLMIVRDITQLHRLESMRKDFVGNVSHELGTPITVIKGYLEAILDNLDGMDAKWHKPMRQMQQHSTRMENIVRDLLMLSSLETKGLTKTQDVIDLKSLFSEIESDTQQMFKDKSHTFELICPPALCLVGKRSELYSAISNLVVNAAKYTPAGGHIKLSANKGTESLNIAVRDNGAGIENHHISRLTERFYRIDGSRSSDTGGTGLGLAIVKHILARHEAELEIKSIYGEGSCFTCRLPLSRAASNSAYDKQSKNSTDKETGQV